MDKQIQQSNLKYKVTTKYMRKATRQWRADQIAKTPYCYVTGSTDLLEVHHSGMSFSQIFRQAHKNLDLEYHKYIFEYSDEDAKALKQEIIRLHDEVEAVVLNHSIHCTLHQVYGQEVSRQDIDSYIKNNHVYTKK